MQLEQAVKERRSVRRYKGEQVSEALLASLIEASCYAPSAMNRQPWYFVAVRSGEAMARLKDIMADASGKMRGKLEKTFPNHPEVVREARGFLETLGGAPTCIAVFLPKDYGPERESMVQSASAAVQNFCLLAHEQGLATCWLTGHLGVRDRIEQEFGAGKGDCIALITVGYAESVPKAPPRHNNVYKFV